MWFQMLFLLCHMSGHLVGGSHSSIEKQLVKSTAPADWATKNLFIYIYIYI